jgi:hypothetical protein
VRGGRKNYLQKIEPLSFRVVSRIFSDRIGPQSISQAMKTMLAVKQVFIRNYASHYLDIKIIERGVETQLYLGVSAPTYRN